MTYVFTSPRKVAYVHNFRTSRGKPTFLRVRGLFRTLLFNSFTVQYLFVSFAAKLFRTCPSTITCPIVNCTVLLRFAISKYVTANISKYVTYLFRYLLLNRVTVQDLFVSFAAKLLRNDAAPAYSHVQVRLQNLMRKP